MNATGFGAGIFDLDSGVGAVHELVKSFFCGSFCCRFGEILEFFKKALTTGSIKVSTDPPLVNIKILVTLGRLSIPKNTTWHGGKDGGIHLTSTPSNQAFLP